MKNKYYISILIFISFSSCKKNFLDVVPGDQVTDATFWRNESDAQKAAVSVYNYWGWAADDGVHNIPTRALYLGEAWSDNGTTSNFWNGFWYNTWSGNVSPQDANIDGYWTALYESIREANVFLANIGKPVMDEAVRKKLIAEVRFIRAYQYHILLNTWGGVPIVDKPLTASELGVPRATPEDVTNFILSDLDAAIPDLDIIPENGRIKKGGAMALKARVLLFAKKWPEAASAAKTLMDLNIHDLFQTTEGDGYQKQFVTDNNTEVLASWKYDVTVRQNEKPALLTWWQWWGEGNPLSPTQALVEAYDTYNAATDQLAPFNAANPYVNRDPRFNFTITTSTGSSTDYGVKKYLGGNEGTENIIIRYAEVLLTYAEAKIESNQIDQSVLDAINKVRARAYGVAVSNVTNYPEITTTSQSALRDIVRNERRVELAMEGLRWYDITRWGIANTVMNGPVLGANGMVSKTRTFSDRDNLRPIPQHQIDLSNKSLVQNPGYN